VFCGGDKLTVRAVTYGTFAASASGDLFPSRMQVRQDFEAMQRAGVNTVRTYTPPPVWMLELARRYGLRILVGVWWEGSNCEYDSDEALAVATHAVRSAVRRCRDYPDVVLAYVIANEIPPLVIRFHGWRVIERFLERLCIAAREEDPGGLVTYGNYPSSEFLQLDFLDFHTLNLYLLERETLAAYLDRMMIQTKGKPLLLGEVGDDSLRPGEARQAELLEWTIPLALEKGVFGVCVFSWTDEWFVGGQRIDDWAFGLVDAARKPKPALRAVSRRYHERLSDWRERWPRVSVVVCNYNGAETLDETLRSLVALDYPDYEVIYVDDGSTDDSLAIARRHEPAIRVIAQENKGLSAARNVGAEAATGEIVAYIDSDAYADPDWLTFLALAFESGDYSAVGGPNLTPVSDGLTAQFIAMCPGNPTCVLKDNVDADHIAGVNMAFKRAALARVGGFDPVHRKAGDDVDVCWRIEDAGMKIAYSPAAIVWHHRRPSIRRYLEQQLGYGEAENQLERKHPERFNLGGYIRWNGRIYLGAKRVSSLFKPFIYHGDLGSGMFQTMYQKDPSYFMYGPSMIHWYLAWIVLLLLSPLSVWLFLMGAVLLGLSVWVALVAGMTLDPPVRLSRRERIDKVWTISLLYFLHPFVRFLGRAVPRIRNRAERVGEKLPVRRRLRELLLLHRRTKEMRHYWGPGAGERERIVRALHAELKTRRASASIGPEWANYDVSLNGTAVACGRIYSAPEHYGQALCYGFKVKTTSLFKWMLVVTAVAATWLTSVHPWLAISFVVPGLLLYRLLGERARLRWHAWEAIETLMQRENATRFGAREHA